MNKSAILLLFVIGILVLNESVDALHQWRRIPTSGTLNRLTPARRRWGGWNQMENMNVEDNGLTDWMIGA
uniref:Uncharacterized protein n=1 Tax=Ciona intestinalis TaxID=7719 RepID=H2XXR7_CIOIN